MCTCGTTVSLSQGEHPDDMRLDLNTEYSVSEALMVNGLGILLPLEQEETTHRIDTSVI